MPRYITAHTTACLTKQALRKLMQTLMEAQEVRVLRCLSSQIAGRMLTEVDAPDQPTLEKFFQGRHVHWEWIMRIDLDGKDGTVTEP